MITAQELLDALADSMGWPRNRPARLISGDRAALVKSVVVTIDDDAVALAPDDASVAVVIATPSAHAGGGRRATDRLISRTTADVATGAWSPADWQLRERVVIDASEMFAGGRNGFDVRAANSLGVAIESQLANAVGLPADLDRLKFVGYVPTEKLQEVRASLFSAGAGNIGDYAECSWSTDGTGTFRGSDSTNPTVGAAGSFEQVAETRFEVVVPGHLRNDVVDAYLRAHPYEEPAYDIFELRSPAPVGIGRLGELDKRRALITVSPLTPLLSQLSHRLADVRIVVCGTVSDAERELLTTRGIELRIADRTATAAQHLDALVAESLGTLPISTSVARPPVFPVEGNAAPVAQQQSLLPEAGGAMRLWYDGGSRGNPGPAAYACVIETSDGEEIEQFGEAIGEVTNNVAEYNGLVNGLKRALELGATSLEIFSDSELIVKQIRGEYKVKHADMKPLYERAKTMLAKLDSYTINHVPRAENATADALVNATLDAAASL